MTELEVTPPGTESEGGTGKTCIWRNSENGSVDFRWRAEGTNGLSATYRAQKNGELKYFVVLPDIEGFPAVANDVVDTRDRGRCSVSVGVSDEVMFALILNQSPSKIGTVDPCEVAARVAGMAAKTLKAGR